MAALKTAEFHQFDIWWAELPAPVGRRPLLLLSRNGSYEYLNKFLAVEITTTVRGIAVELPLGKAEGLSARSVANFDNIRTVARSALTKRTGRLAASRWIEAKQALGHALGWDELIEIG